VIPALMTLGYPLPGHKHNFLNNLTQIPVYARLYEPLRWFIRARQTTQWQKDSQDVAGFREHREKDGKRGPVPGKPSIKAEFHGFRCLPRLRSDHNRAEA